MGIPFGDNYTLELGKLRDTWGPLPTTYNFFYDDVNETGGHMIVKAGNLMIVPTVIWMDEAQNNYITYGTTVSGQDFPVANDTVKDNDEIRYMVGAKYTINKDWMVGGLIGYQQDDRDEFSAAQMLALYGCPLSLWHPGQHRRLRLHLHQGQGRPNRICRRVGGDRC